MNQSIMRLRVLIKSLRVQSLGFRHTDNKQRQNCCKVLSWLYVGKKSGNSSKPSGLKLATVTHIRNILSDESG